MSKRWIDLRLRRWAVGLVRMRTWQIRIWEIRVGGLRRRSTALLRRDTKPLLLLSLSGRLLSTVVLILSRFQSEAARKSVSIVDDSSKERPDVFMVFLS